MEGSSLQSRYMRYKEGTQKFIDWLVHTASNCGVSSDIFKDLLKRAGIKSHLKNNSSKERAVVATVTEILALSKAVAANKKTVVPPAILKVLQDAISGREACAAWYMKQSIPADSSDSHKDGHAFFIATLRKVHASLSVISTPHVPATPSGAKLDNYLQNKPKDVLNNAFASLQIHKPLDDTPEALDSLCSASANAKPTAAPVLQVKLRETTQDTAFALWCLLEELSELRTAVLEA